MIYDVGIEVNENRRRHPRHPIAVSIKISHPDIGHRIVKTKDFSDSGVFVLVEPDDMPPPGEVVLGQVQGMVDDPPILSMEVVRVESHGLGLKYIDA